MLFYFDNRERKIIEESKVLIVKYLYYFLFKIKINYLKFFFLQFFLVFQALYKRNLHLFCKKKDIFDINRIQVNRLIKIF